MAGSRRALKEAPQMSYGVVGWTWSGTIPWIKPAGQPYKGGFKQAAEFITWGVRGGLTKDRLAPVFVPGPRVDTGEAVDVAPSPLGQGHVVRVLLGLDEARPGICPKGHRCLWASTSFLNVSACSTSSNLSASHVPPRPPGASGAGSSPFRSCGPLPDRCHEAHGGPEIRPRLAVAGPPRRTKKPLTGVSAGQGLP
ncbi:hypothetical protein B9S64_11000 [Streptomyces sp. SM18]|nr:hypothetical protein B9S64_11000 [Streptomyces sp. SM18]